MRILIVEDNERLSSLILEALRDSGFGGDAVATAADFLSAAQSVTYDLFIVDLLLPDGDGLDAIRTLRMRRCRAPILIITAKGKIDDRVNGLDAGADDYLIKPFNYQELLARVRALLRRPQNSVNPVQQLANLALTDATGEVQCSGNPILLRRAERELLALLMRRDGRVVTKPVIEDILSPAKKVSHNALETHISRLRKALKGLDSGVVIETLRGTGYMLRVLDGAALRDARYAKNKAHRGK
jgi:DNA-binding response OmpR family regulator